MYSKLCLVLLLLGCSLIASVVSASKFYDDNTIQEYNCSVSFKETKRFDCACVTGLWILYDSCSGNATNAGNVVVGCEELKDAPVNVAAQVLRNQEEIAVVEPDGMVTKLDPGTVTSVDWSKTDLALVTASNWTLTDGNGKKICVSVTEPESYCFFTQSENTPVTNVEKGCAQQSDQVLKAQKCESVAGKTENVCEAGTVRALSSHTRWNEGINIPAGKVKPRDKPEATTAKDNLISILTENLAQGLDPTIGTGLIGTMQDLGLIVNNDTLVAEPALGGDDEDHQIAQINADKINEAANATSLIAQINNTIETLMTNASAPPIIISQAPPTLITQVAVTTQNNASDPANLIAQINTNIKNNASEPSTIMADEILRFMTMLLEQVLKLQELRGTLQAAPGKTNTVPVDVAVGEGIGVQQEFTTYSDANPMNTTYSYPPYEFLDIAKRITQRTCPSFYVKPDFLDLAVAVFIRLQQVQFKLMETVFNPVEVRRVLQYLRNCEQHAVNFDFNDANCDGVVDGKYNAYGETLELLVPSDLVDLNRDPIVETVWKIFYNAHSYCYQFFEKKLDHHRFTTWMVPLFQNQIGDVWTTGETTEQFFNGMFGNQLKVQESLAYCAVSSRLGSGYPFDLPRPVRVADLGASILGMEAIQAVNRDMTKPKLIPSKFGNRMDTTKPLLCQGHVKTIVSKS